MNRMWYVAFAFLAGIGAALGADPAADERTGLKVGDKAPEFTLRDQNGNEKELTVLLRDGPVALVFYRSASW